MQWCFSHCYSPSAPLPTNKKNSPSLEEAYFQLSVDSEMIVPFACFKYGWNHTIHSGVLSSFAHSLEFHQCPHS